MEYTWWGIKKNAFLMGRNKFYIAKQKAKNGYAFAGLDSPSVYIKDYIKCMIKNMRCKIQIPFYYHEIITNWTKRRPYFDIDFTDSAKYKIDIDEFLHLVISNTKEELLSIGHEISNDNVFILKSTQDKDEIPKHSYHIVITGCYFENHTQSLHFASNVRTKIEQTGIERVYLEAMDMNVYNSDHQMRMFGSKKRNSERVFELTNFSYKDLNIIHEIEKMDHEEKTEYILSNTIIQNVQVADILLSYANLLSLNYSDDIPDLSDEDYNKLKTMVDYILPEEDMVDSDGNPALYIQSTKNNSITFGRLLSSNCSLCNTVHDSVGFVVYANISGDMYRVCFSGIKKGLVPLKIGNFREPFDVNQKQKPKFHYRTKRDINHERINMNGSEVIQHLIGKYGLLVRQKSYDGLKNNLI